MGSKITISLEDHSKAKVQLWDTYLRTYLNILSRVSFVKSLKIYDLFCGEGRYADNNPGSPIITLEAIKDHYFSNNSKCPDIQLFFNDNGISKVEPLKKRIERVKEFSSKIFKPQNVQVEFSEDNASIAFAKAISLAKLMKQDERALLFIDPWGYKFIKPTELKELLENGKTEVLLFLPTSHMYRFTNKAMSESVFPGGKPLEQFVIELFGENKPDLSSSLKYIQSLKDQFRDFLHVEFSDTFTIEREKGNFFSLFFFTNNSRGYHKMLEAKWKIDESQGRGFKVGSNNGQIAMFDHIEVVGYDNKLKEFLVSNGGATNKEITEFGLNSGFLPKHTKQVLDYLDKNCKIVRTSLDNMPIQGWYLDNKNRLIHIKIL